MTVYPKALQRPLKDHSDKGTLAQRNLVVEHITAGPTAQSAMWTFINSKRPKRVSAHFVIDRDGTVYQLLPLEDTAWHAEAVNHRSVGVEHAAIPNDPHHAITDMQYAASAELLAWICRTLKIPIDKQHVQGHEQASPQDHHEGCCEPTLSVDALIHGAILVQQTLIAPQVT